MSSLQQKRCKRGHLLKNARVTILPDGRIKRECRICCALRAKKHYEKIKQDNTKKTQ